MQVSTYEIAFPLSDDKHVLMNGLYGAVDIVPSEEAELITQAKNDPSLLERFSSSRLEMLIDRGHVVNDLEQEAQDLRIISRLHTLFMSRGRAGIVLMPTYNCNFRCVYCFEQHRLSRGQEWLEHTITPSMLDDIFRQVKDFKARGYSVKSCTLYGGEPLLARNKDLIRNICERCRENDIAIEALTNGYDLDSFIDLIDEFKFAWLQVTLDGIKDIHDQQRPLAGGGGSYDKIMSNIGLALEHGVNVSVRSTVTSKSISGIKTLQDEFKSRGFTDKSCFSYYFKAVFDSDNAVSQEDVLNELLRTGTPPEEAIKLTGGYSELETRLSSWLNKKILPRLNPTSCGSENGTYVIDPYGKIFPCWELVGKDDEEMGFIDGGRFIYNFNIAKWRTRTSDRMPKCSKCPYLMICGGGCARAGIKHLMEGNCEDFQERFDFLAPIVIRKALNGDYAGKTEPHHEDVSKDRGDSMLSSVKSPSKYSDDPSCLSLSVRELLSKLTPDGRNTLMTTNSEKEAAEVLGHIFE